MPAEEGRYLSEAAKLLQEAIGLFDEAMDIQEAEVNANKAVNTRDGMQDVDMGDEPEAVAPNEVKDEDEKMGKDDDDGGQWALVKEAVTVEDILDTALAELQTLVTLWGLCQYVEGHSDPLTFVRNTGNKLLDKISMLAAPSPDNLPEIALAKANYTVAAADAYFKAGRLSLKYYDTQVRESFTDGKDGLTVSGVAATLGHKAQAHIQFGTTVSESSTSDETAGKLVWSHYSAAAKDLAAAATLDTRKANLHCLRGDVEMWRSKVNTPLPEATRKTLLQNAGVYYRGALRVAQATNDSSEIAIEAAVKERMVAIEKEDPHPYPDATLANIAYNGDWRKVAEEAVQDGLFEQSTMAVLETMIH